MMKSSSWNITDVSPPTQADINDLLQLGMLVESVTFPDLPMAEAITKVLETPSILANISSFLSPTVQNPQSTLKSILNVLDYLPHDSAQEAVRIALLVPTILVALVVLLRIYARKKVTEKIWADDWWAISALVCSILTCVVYMLTMKIGAGALHIWDVSFNRIQTWLLLVFISELLFSITLIPIKLSFLVFYHSLSPDLWYRRSIYGVGFLVLATTVAGIFMITFQCRPIDFWYHIFDAKCIDRVGVFSSWGALTVVTDIMLLLLPVRKVAQLNFRKREKIIIIGMFSAGGIICICSILRVISSNKVFTEVDKSWLMGLPGIWSLLEVHLAIVISSLPALKHLFIHTNNDRTSFGSRRIFNTLFRKTRANSLSGPSVRATRATISRQSSSAHDSTTISRISNGLRSWGSRLIVTRTTATLDTDKSGVVTQGTSARDEEERIWTDGKIGGLSAPKHYSYAKAGPSNRCSTVSEKPLSGG